MEKLNSELIELVRIKNQLSLLNYADENYDELEEQLHDLEDDFVENFGDILEEALHNIHDEYCPDNDVLLPIAYLANKYEISDSNEYSVSPSSGVFVDADDYEGKPTRLVLLPNPVRFELIVGSELKQVVWKAGDK